MCVVSLLLSRIFLKEKLSWKTYIFIGVVIIGILLLAVAEELTPNAPLVLDDAFVRFDDTRLKAALEILKNTAKQKQVILFTCQHREKEILK